MINHRPVIKKWVDGGQKLDNQRTPTGPKPSSDTVSEDKKENSPPKINLATDAAPHAPGNVARGTWHRALWSDTGEMSVAPCNTREPRSLSPTRNQGKETTT